MFTEDHQSFSNKRYDTKATSFFRMGPNNFVTFARFSISHRSDIARFIQRLDNDTQKQVDTFFICQQINLTASPQRPTYFAVFNYFVGSPQHTKFTLQAVQYCKVLEVTAMSIRELYENMCQTDFIQISMFARLGRAETKILKKTTNPFAEIYLYRNVSLFSNIDMAIKFINEDMSTFKNLSEYLQKRPQITEEQKRLSYILFGTINRNGIHLIEETKKAVLRLSSQLKKYEIKNEETYMREETQEFDDVTYSDFQENVAMTQQDFLMITNLKNMRNDSISKIRQQLKDAERKLNREDPFEKI